MPDFYSPFIPQFTQEVVDHVVTGEPMDDVTSPFSPSYWIKGTQGGGELDKKTYEDGTNKVTDRTGYEQHGVGEWSGPDGAKSEGVNVEAGARKLSGEHSTRWFDINWDAGAGTSSMKKVKTTNPDGSTSKELSGAVNEAEANLQISSKDKADSIKIGGSVGDGAGARRITKDIDGDGDQDQIGFGVDYGPVSLDVKSETVAKQIHALDVPGVIGDSPIVSPFDVFL